METDNDILEPLAEYAGLKEGFAKNCADFFEALVKKSGISEHGNTTTVAKIRKLEAVISKSGSWHKRWSSLRTFLWMAVAFLALMAVTHSCDKGANGMYINIELAWVLPCLAGVILLIVLIIKWLTPRIRALGRELERLKQELRQEMDAAWTQMAPLNMLYDWDVFARLLATVMPRVQMDPFFSRGRLEHLKAGFGWSDNFNGNRSVVFSQSGAIAGNPFVLAETIDFEMSTKTYTGELHISWTEVERYTDSNGNRRTRLVTRHQTLTASVEKPAPAYKRSKFVIYGNEAAPDLHFTRQPSALSGLDDGFRARRLKNKEIKQLEERSRELDGKSRFTVMANREFDALFHAIDRNHETQFRLLFTPLAQQNMLSLLNDKKVGYGDDFFFSKTGMINWVAPNHLSGFDIAADPASFANYELAAARVFFNRYLNEYFKAFYFAMAPLLCIPLYQQHRSHNDIYQGIYGKRASFWEHEAAANHLGEAHFKHPQSITQNILKTESSDTIVGSEITVTAHGFNGIARTDYIPVRGGDGKTHRVPVHWTEYIPVSRASRFVIREAEEMARPTYQSQAGASESWRNFFRHWGTSPADAVYRRSLVSLLRGK